MANIRKAASREKRSSVAASVLTQRDADRFKKVANKWGRDAAKTKKKAKDTLVKLGIHTKSGKLTKKYI